MMCDSGPNRESSSPGCEQSGQPLFPEPIAIIGIGCRLPGRATSPESFWKNLVAGVDAITEVPADRWNLRSYYDPEPGKPGKSHACRGGFIDGVDQFDPHFFSISPREAARMDPQQRLLLEVAWEALEDGGQPLPRLAGTPVAVFVGVSSWDYSVLQTSFRDRGAIDVYMNTGGSLSIAANRISYCFDFRGASAAVDTACSSALTAVHLACRSIWVEKAPLALAGGVNALLTPDWYVGFSRMGMLSPDGRCKAFDARANGFVRSEGAAIVVLKPLARAVADGDRIYALIRATAANQDGRTEGMTAPSGAAQRELLRQACRDAGVQPADIQYIEAHGTGTPVGDPIEAAAIGAVVGDGRPAGRPCVLGSVKTNIGHLEAGSGAAGLIKTALALHHRQIPGNLHFEQPNPTIDFERLNLRVPTTLEPWPETPGPALAGVNSFGYGGANAHLVLEGAAPPASDVNAGTEIRSSVLTPLSARSPEALRAAAADWLRFLGEGGADAALHDVAVNAAERRTHHSHRLAVVAHSKEQLAEGIAAFSSGKPAANVVSGRTISGQQPRVAFICAGQGPQWWGMGRQLLREEPLFRNRIERCDAIVRTLGPWSLLEELTAEESLSRMSETRISQPSIFAIQVALAALWESWGVRPEAVIGHSVGEVAAAYVAGVFDLEDAVRIIYHRGRCMDRASSHGRMLAVGLTSDEAQRLIRPYGDRVSIAAVNAPTSLTLSGEAEPLEAIARKLESRNVFARFLQVSYAFHSAQMDPVRDELLHSLQGIRPRPARLPFFSTVTGQRVSGVEPCTDCVGHCTGRRCEGTELGPEYWWHNVRQTVRFAQGVDHLVELGCDTTVELSPHPVLTSAVMECCQARGKQVIALASLRRREDERATMLRSVAELHLHGCPLDWRNVTPGPRRFLRLPTYSWQHRRFWSESEESQATRLAAPVHPLLGLPTGKPRPAWEARLDPRLLPSLADHRVQGVAILPAAAYVEAAVAAGRELFGQVGRRLEDLTLANPCFLPEDGALWLHTAFNPDDSTIAIASRPTGAETRTWTPHVQVIVRSSAADPPAGGIDLELVRGRCTQQFSREQSYSYFARLGLEYGPRFQGIERCWQGRLEALGEVALPGEWTQPDAEWILHPALLDSCFQVVVAADPDFNRHPGDLYLPVKIDRIQLHRASSRRLWSHARLREKTDRTLVADLDIYDEHGQPVAAIRGLRSQRVANADRETLDDLLYAYTWVEKAPPAEEPAAQPGAWLILADRTGLGDQLAEELRRTGHDCAVVAPGPGFAALETHRWLINPSSRDDMRRLLSAIREGSLLPWRGIVHLWALNAHSPSDLQSADLKPDLEMSLLSALHLVQTWQPGRDEEPPRLLLVTRGAQSLGETPQDVEVAQAPLIGFGRVVINEFAGFRVKLVDLDAKEDALPSLASEILVADDEDETAWRDGRRYVHRFTPTRGDGPRIDLARTSEAYRLMTTRPGAIDGLTLGAVCRTPPGPGEVEIEVRAAGLNFSDVMKALGLYPGLPDGPPPFGAECSGVITAVGDGVEGWSVGDAAIAVAPFAFASHAVARAELIARKPPSLSFEAAATIPIAFLTAAYALDQLARLERGERVLIHSATGGVGLAAVQLARRAGAQVFATAGSAEKRQYLHDLGIEHVMNSRTLAFADEVLEATGGRGVDVVLNSLAGEAITHGIAALAEYGRFLEIGKRDIYQNTRIGLQPFQKNLSFFAIDLDRVMRERPALLGKLLRQIVEQIGAGELQPLPQRVFPVGEIAAAFRFMQHGKHIGKVIVSMSERPAAVAPGEEPVRFHADASYLITGGFGGFGMATARWLAERGARHLVLVGRRGAVTDGARQAVAELEQRGVQVTIAQVDISSEEDVSNLLATIAEDLPPLRGVLHAAMVLEDCLLQNLDGERLHRVLAPKVQGTWNLHTQTRRLQLDHFVLFSSLSSVFGHAGQANYAAANAFLDLLAWHRRAEGLPCLTVNWGHLGEVGYLAERHELSERLARQGVLPFTLHEAFQLLERALQRRSVQVSVMRVDWSRWKGLGVTGRASPRFAELLRRAAPTRDDGAHATSTRARIQSCPVADRATVLGAILRDKLARVLGAPLDSTDWESSLLQLGLDSLMAVELVNWIRAELGVALQVVELMRSSGASSLARLLLDRLDGGASAAPRQLQETTTAEAVFPLSHGQRALSFLHQMDPASPALNLSFCSRISSPIDVDAFRQAFQTLIDRHPALRTTFVDRDGEIVQHVHDHSEVALQLIDAAAFSEDGIRRCVEQEAARPFDLERGPLLRMSLFMRSPQDHVFVLTAHHIVGDFWSLVVLMEELRAAYPAALAGKAPELAPVESNYRRFVRWQGERLAGAEGEQLWSWWQRRLAGAPHVLDLPTDRPRPARFTHRGGSVSCRLDNDLTARLKEFATREESTLFAALLAGFQAMLFRLTGQDDFVVGSPFAGRPSREFEGVVGYFINMLPLRARLGGDLSFRTLLRNVCAGVFEAFEYQDYPFSLIVDRLGVERDPSRTPLIQASFTLEKAHRPGEIGASRFLLPQSQIRMEIGGLQTQPFPFEQRMCQADLEMVLEEHDGAVQGMLCYNTDLFDAATAERFAGLYRDLLLALTESPDAPLARAAFLNERERTRVIEEWNQTQVDFGEPACIHTLFEKQAAATPDAVAVHQQDRLLCYGELDAWANAVARTLRGQGVGVGELVCLSLYRSPEMIAAILGVLKAGAAYVPLDPETPRERLRHILGETRTSILITHDRLRGCSSGLDVDALGMESDLKQPGENENQGAPESGVGVRDRAYVIYTSGSTGKPKGVQVEHDAVANTLLWRQHALPLRPNDRVLLNVPYHFDASVVVIFPALLSGAQLVLARPGEERSPALLLSRIAQDRATVVHCLPSTLQAMLDEPGFASATESVARFCCGGEAMPPRLSHRLSALSRSELHNLYGPTEAAVEATHWQCRPDGDDAVAPIGRPIENARVYVLDAQRQPTPIGVPGELYIGGAGLARGYLNDDELTADRFVPDPFASTPSALMFRTGDRVRWRADGVLVLLGRIDRQVKINGYRIEPAEVEAALMEHPSVKEAAVTVQADASGNRLIAYTVPRAGAGASPEDLRRHLAGLLPRSLTPARFVSLLEIPRTGTGKVDFKALPALNGDRSHMERAVVGPRDRLEAFLAEIWSDLLTGVNIDIDDHFFELGGNSIQALTAVHRIRERLGERVATAAIFDSPTIAGLAHRLRGAHPEAVARIFGRESAEPLQASNGKPHAMTQSAASDLLAPLQVQGDGAPLFLVHPPGGIVACYQALATQLGRDRPVYGVRARGLSPEERVPARLEEMAAEYIAAVRTIQPDGPYLLGGWSLGGVIAYEMAQQLQEAGDAVELLALLDSTLPFGPMNAAYLEGIDQSGREFGLDFTLEELGELTADEQLPFLWQHVKNLGLVDDEAPPEMVREVIQDLKRLFHAHVCLVADYAVRPYPGRITLFRPSDSPTAAATPADRGWSRLAEVEVQFVPGRHHTMVKDPHVRTLARELLACLNRPQARRERAARAR